MWDFITLEQYLNNRRQETIDRSVEKSKNRMLPTVPYIPVESKEQWHDRITNTINDFESTIRNGKDTLDEQTLNVYIQTLSSLKEELNNGWTPKLCAGDSCVYTATDNYGKKYRVSGNQSFRADPAKYGFQEINLNDIKPGDIIQDFSNRDNMPHHAMTFIGYDNNNKALFNYSKGGGTEESIVKNGHYPFFWDDERSVHLDGMNNNKLQHSAAAYRFIGTEDDNKQWEEDYTKYRMDYDKKFLEQLKNVPILNLPKLIPVKNINALAK